MKYGSILTEYVYGDSGASCVERLVDWIAIELQRHESRELQPRARLAADRNERDGQSCGYELLSSAGEWGGWTGQVWLDDFFVAELK